MAYSKSDFFNWDEDLDLDLLLGDYTHDESELSDSDDDFQSTKRKKSENIQPLKKDQKKSVYACDKCVKGYASISGIRVHMRANIFVFVYGA
jgi:hypothetical protein